MGAEQLELPFSSAGAPESTSSGAGGVPRCPEAAAALLKPP